MDIAWLRSRRFGSTVKSFILALSSDACSIGFGAGYRSFRQIERERRHKEAELRPFAFAAVLGTVGGLLGDSFSLLALGLVCVLVVFFNVETIRTSKRYNRLNIGLSGFVSV